MDVRSRVERNGKGVGLVREVMGLERRFRERRLERFVRGDSEERVLRLLEVRLRSLRGSIGRGRGGGRRSFEASDRVVRAGK